MYMSLKSPHSKSCVFFPVCVSLPNVAFSAFFLSARHSIELTGRCASYLHAIGGFGCDFVCFLNVNTYPVILGLGDFDKPFWGFISHIKNGTLFSFKACNKIWKSGSLLIFDYDAWCHIYISYVCTSQYYDLLIEILWSLDGKWWKQGRFEDTLPFVGHDIHVRSHHRTFWDHCKPRWSDVLCVRVIPPFMTSRGPPCSLLFKNLWHFSIHPLDAETSSPTWDERYIYLLLLYHKNQPFMR